MKETPKIFISYSWSSSSHERWVLELAERLVSDGVDVTLDKWDLKEGQDKFSFMESMVNSKDIQKVLLILDENYKAKADSRAGGVGTETQIISPKIYSNVSQDKFIPIVAEYDEDGAPYLPTFLKSRIYIDLVYREQYEKGYEDLIRNIYDRPSNRKPKIGSPPSYLFEETPSTIKTSSIVGSFDYQIDKNPKRINSLTSDFLDKFFESLKEYSLEFGTRNIYEIGKKICENINTVTPLRNDFIEFMLKATKLEFEGILELDIITNFLEKLTLLHRPLNDSGSHTSADNFKFITHEIFLYFVAIGLNNNNYVFVETLLYSSYFFKDSYNYQLEPKRFNELYNNIEVINEYYNSTYSKKFFSPMADLIIKRVPEEIDQNYLVDADLLCHYIGVMDNLHWFPLIYIYKREGDTSIFDRLVSKRYFEKTKELFAVSSIDELKRKLQKIREDDGKPYQWGYSGAFDRIKPIYQAINIDKIGSLR